MENKKNKFREFLFAPFRTQTGINIPLVVVFLIINSTVLFNAIYHHSRIGYDSTHHIKYIELLSEFRLPRPDDTPQFFSPPLSYFLPSLMKSLGPWSLETARKFAQYLNLFYSIVLTFYLIKICELIRPKEGSYKTVSLGLMGVLPVYYKTFAFIRPEPLLAMLCVLAVYGALKVFVEGAKRLRSIVTLGLLLGLVILTRQWGFAIFPAIVIFAGILTAKRKSEWLAFSKAVSISLLVAVLVGGWFYINLYRHHGAITAFNRPGSPTFSFSNQPLEFYFGVGSGKLFTDPVRWSFPNQLLPIFHSEAWGDYGCYFIVYGRDTRKKRFVSGYRLTKKFKEEHLPEWLETNRYDVNKYLGRVNAVSIFPSVVLLGGLFLGTAYFVRFVFRRSGEERTALYSLLYLFVMISAAGYFWFLIMHPNLDKGDTIKATYMLQVFPFCAILSGELLERIRQKYIYIWWTILLILIATFLHNFPVCITRYRL